MKHIAYCNADDIVQYTVSLHDTAEALEHDGMTMVVLDGPLPRVPHKLLEGVPVPYEPEISFERQKIDKWEAMKAFRTKAIDADLITPYGTFDCDRESREQIAGAVTHAQTLASVGQSVAIDFTLADNTHVTLDLEALTSVALLLGQKTQAAYARGRELRAQINETIDTHGLSVLQWPMK